MSDGVEESKIESEQDAYGRAHPDRYGRAVSKVAVAQICEGVGFECFKESSLVALSDVAIKYICNLGKSASFYANFAGRLECSIFDIFKGLEDMGLGSTSAFSGASNILTMEEIPFSQPIPQFPVIKSPKIIPSSLRLDEVPRDIHIPAWLPAFPDPHTYIQSPIWNGRKTDARADIVEQARQRRKAEKSLLNLQQRLLSNGGKDNPFLAPPLPAGEKDISNVDLPAKLVKKHASVLETFSPVIDVLKSGGVSDSMDLDSRIIISDRRPVVHFKLKAGKKMVGEDLDVNIRNMGNEKKARWVGRDDDDKDDKKRRAELILRQSIENSQEFSQM